MLKHTLAITVAVAAVSLLTPGVGSAGVACTPHCAPVQSSNSGGELKGLSRANQVAGEHGTWTNQVAGEDRAYGRANAVEKLNEHNPHGSGVSTSPPPVPPPGDTGGDTGGGGDPCSGC